MDYYYAIQLPSGKVSSPQLSWSWMPVCETHFGNPFRQRMEHDGLFGLWHVRSDRPSIKGREAPVTRMKDQYETCIVRDRITGDTIACIHRCQWAAALQRLQPRPKYRLKPHVAKNIIARVICKVATRRLAHARSK